MVLARIYKEKNRREAAEEGRKEVQAAWEDWNRRRLEAESKGEAFTEPPPGGAQNH